MTSARHTLTCVAVALVAGGAGLLFGLLYAPVSGRETRRMIGRRLEEGGETIERRGRHALEDIKTYVEEKMEEGREALAQVAGR